MTLYPTTKCTPARAVDILEMVGTDRIMVNSAGDWGKSDPLGRAGVHPGNETAWPPGGDHPQGRARQSAGVLAAVHPLAGVDTGKQNAGGAQIKKETLAV